MKWWHYLAGGVAAIAGLAFAVVILYLMFVDPRMKDQLNIRTFEREMPPPPPQSVTLKFPRTPLPNPDQAQTMVNPLPPTVENLAAGKTWYGYYCGFCHGEPGEYTGPVGESFVPTPPRITTALIADQSPGQLVRAMLTGKGHQPVLSRVVYPESWWQLELYLRALARENDEITTFK